MNMEIDYLAQMEEEAARRRLRQASARVPLRTPSVQPKPGLWDRFKTVARDSWNEAVERQGGLGFSAETKQALSMDKPATTSAAHAILRPAQQAAELGFMGLQAVGAGLEVGANVVDAVSEETGLADKLSVDGNKFLPGSAGMALLEAFPTAGAGTGRAAMGATRATETGITRLPFRASAIKQRVGLPVKFDKPLKAVGEKAVVAPKVEPVVAPKAATTPAPAPAEIPQTTPTKPVDLTPEPGALLHPEEWKGNGEAVRQLAQERIGKLSPAEIEAMAARLDQAEMDGRVVDDPHYRSVMNVIVNEKGMHPEQRLAVLNVFEETTQEIAERAGAGPKTLAEMQQEFRKVVAGGLTREELTEMADIHAGSATRARLGQQTMVASGIRFIKAREEMVAARKAGDTNARAKAFDIINDAIIDYSTGKRMVGDTGRALNALRAETPLALGDDAEDVLLVTDPKHIEGRLRDALEELDDDDLIDILDQMKTGEDLDRVAEALMNPVVAKEVSNVRRLRNSVSMALRSNALSPATALFNGASLAIENGYRQVSRRWGARVEARRGYLTEAEGLRIEAEIASAVYWDAARAGFNAMIDNIKWEFWGDVERIAGVGWGSGKVRLLAKEKRAKAVGGRRTEELREFEEEPRARITDIDAFNTRMASLQTGGGFGGLWAHAMRTGAVALNTVDAVSGASIRLFTGALDVFGRNAITLQERYATSARFAFSEGRTLGFTHEDLKAYTIKRAKELAEIPEADILQQTAEALQAGEAVPHALKFLAERDKAVKQIADFTLFNDGPQTFVGRKSADAANLADAAAGLFLFRGVLMPYIKTPIRLFERGLVTNTPFGRFSDEVRDILAKGGPEAAIAEARMEVGGMALATGFAAGVAGLMVFTDGSWDNTRKLGGGNAGRLQIGDAYFEINRLDPLALTLAIGGIMGQALKESSADLDAYDTEQAWATATEIAFHGLGDSFLNKSYLTGIRDFSEIVFSKDVDTMGARMEQLAAGVTARMIPLAGTSRMANDTIRGDAPDTVGMVATVLRNVPGGGLLLGPRRDVLGNVIDGRTLGISLGLVKSSAPVVERLRELAIDVADIKLADPTGFKMTGDQLNELRRIRGHEALNAEFETLDEALMTLFESEEFLYAPEKSQKREVVLEVIRDFNEPARAILEEQDPTFRSNRIANKAFKDYMKGSDEEPRMSRVDALQAAREDVAAEGLPQPDLN